MNKIGQYIPHPNVQIKMKDNRPDDCKQLPELKTYGDNQL